MKFEAIAKAFTKKDLPHSEVEFVGEVPYDAVAPYREHALLDIAKEVEIPGFRKGHVPHDLVLKRVGEVSVLEEAVEHFVRDFYPELERQTSLMLLAALILPLLSSPPATLLGLRFGLHNTQK